MIDESKETKIQLTAPVKPGQQSSLRRPLADITNSFNSLTRNDLSRPEPSSSSQLQHEKTYFADKMTINTSGAFSRKKIDYDTQKDECPYSLPFKPWMDPTFSIKCETDRSGMTIFNEIEDPEKELGIIFTPSFSIWED